jgi:hypothetical protein
LKQIDFVLIKISCLTKYENHMKFFGSIFQQEESDLLVLKNEKF